MDRLIKVGYELKPTYAPVLSRTGNGQKPTQCGWLSVLATLESGDPTVYASSERPHNVLTRYAI